MGGFAAWLGKSALMMSPVGGILKAIPAKAWLYIAIAIAVVVAGVVAHSKHQAAISRVKAEAYAQGVADTKAAQKAANKTFVAKSETINSNIRKKANEEASRSARGFDDVRLHGPGKAVCPGSAIAPSSASRHVEAPAAAGAPVGQVPDSGRPDLIAVPFDDFLTVIERGDQAIIEDRAWRDSDTQQRALTEQSQPKGE